MRVLRSPALHFVLIGLTLYAWDGTRLPAEEARRIVIPQSRIDRAHSAFVRVNGRAPDADERRTFVDHIVEQEVLYQYALELGLHEQPVVRRRLAQIARFVAENPHERSTEEERAAHAVELGLHHGDLVVRRILIDGARRLIRAPWLVRRPDEATLQSYLDAHGEEFLAPAVTRITQIAVNRLKHGESAEGRALAIAEMLRAGAVPPEEAIALGDELQVPAALPSLSEPDLARKLGHRFARGVADVPAGEWSEPLPSIHGLHVVYVHERAPAYVPPLSEVRDRVRRRFLQSLADRWLDLRLAQLRSSFEIVLPPEVP